MELAKDIQDIDHGCSKADRCFYQAIKLPVLINVFNPNSSTSMP